MALPVVSWVALAGVDAVGGDPLRRLPLPAAGSLEVVAVDCNLVSFPPLKVCGPGRSNRITRQRQ